jgi:plastocyanin
MKNIFTLFLSLFLLANAFSQTTHTVNAGYPYYTPTNLTIELGDSVVWINDGGLHDVNGDIETTTGDAYNNPETFDSPSTSEVGGVIFGYRFTVEGTYNYDCSVGSHAANGMIGSVIVNPAPAYTAIPDENFEQALIVLEIDDVLDGQVLTSSINSIDSLEVESYNISDLSGIEDFTALIALNCGENTITSIDVSQNTALKTLAVYGNELTSIDVSNNVNLTELDVEENQLTNLNISNNTLLKILFCSVNQLTDLDVSANTDLQELVAYENQLTTMDVSLNTSLIYADFEINQLTCLNLKNGNNTNFIELWTQENPALSCIEVDDSVYANTNWINNDDFYLDDDHYFSNDCNYLSSSCGSTSTNIVENTTELQVYPNPTNGEFTIDLGSYSGSIQTELFDISGRSLIKGSQEKMTLTNYPDGLYFLRVILDNKTEEIRLIKQ